MSETTVILQKLQELEISGCNGNYQQLVVDRILKRGKQLEDLTIGELRWIIKNANKDWNNAGLTGAAVAASKGGMK